MAITSIFEISKQSLLKHQAAINTTAKNIANVNTEGYTRLCPDFTSVTGLGLNQLQQGLTLEGAVQLRQSFAESQILYERQDLGKHETAELLYSQIEEIFAEPSDTGLSNVMSEFWDSWSDLANNPESQTARSEVKNKGIILARSFNQTYTQLENLRDNLRKEIDIRVREANQLITQIGTLNSQIESKPGFDLIDQRNQLLEQLAEKLPIDVLVQESGSVIVSTGGLVLASNTETHLLGTTTTADGNTMTSHLTYAESGRVLKLESGELSSLTEIHDTVIPEYQAKMDQMAQALTAQSNRVHASGYNQSGITGINFFVPGIDSAVNMAVNPDILNNPQYIAASASASDKGDGSVAQQLSDLRYEDIVNGNTVSEAYFTLVGDIGNAKQSSSFLRLNQEKVVQNLQNQRDAVSAVSLDEEMARLIQFEQGYNAAARLINTVDEMFDQVLAMMG
ncbi:MAG: flagellar hook-associated protein FlgK [Candidatus Neomarinimicrobiota bacterium]